MQYPQNTPGNPTRKSYQEMWGLPLFDQRDSDPVMWELDQLLNSKPGSEGSI